MTRHGSNSPTAARYRCPRRSRHRRAAAKSSSATPCRCSATRTTSSCSTVKAPRGNAQLRSRPSDCSTRTTQSVPMTATYAIVHDPREEFASALTHGVGAAAALAGGAVLIALAALHGDGWQLTAAIVFGICLLLLYVASTLYHAVPAPVAKTRLKVFDHCAIYLDRKSTRLNSSH